MASATAPPRARLHVSGLPRELLDDELRARFAPFGAVRAVEVLREKRDSPFRRWHDDLGGDDADPLRGSRVGRVGRVGRGGGLAAVVAVAPRRPPPCRGFAYVELAPKDAKSLARCVTLYNGCKWKGGVMRVERAKPRWDERLREELEERDGGEKRPRRAGGRDADGPGRDSLPFTARAGFRVSDARETHEVPGRSRWVPWRRFAAPRTLNPKP
jgi:RNA recognition motif-containing protein